MSGDFVPTGLHLEARGTHPDHYRPGEWALILGYTNPGERSCVDVIFPDGAVDTWVLNDPANPLEIRTGPLGGGFTL